MDPDADLSEGENRGLVQRIREALGRRRMSRQALADAAKISISTLENALNGSRPFTLATIVRIEAALGLSLRPAPAAGSAHANLGGYARAGVTWLEGDYLTLQPSFEVADAIFAYRTQIAWDDASASLHFRETHRLDAAFSQAGAVSLPNKSGHIYLHSNEEGQMRLAILGRPLISGELYGLLTTLQAGAGTQLIPVSVPLALIPFQATAALGRIAQDDNAWAAYHEHLERVISGGFAKLLSA